MDTVELSLKTLLAVATLAPLASFFVILVFAPKLGKAGAWLATGAIVFACVCALVSLVVFWLPSHPPGGDHGEAIARDADHKEHGDDHAGHESEDADAGHGAHEDESPSYYAGDYYPLGQFGDLRITIGYYIDSLTVCMFCMVTLIASCIHFYAMGYMSEELDDEVTDHEVTMSDGSHLKRPGRYPRFFQYLSLFCFSMLGLVLAGNIAMVFVFWELVGICSYFLIGFYVERKSASTAANKAFIVNRVGDFGMLIGLMALWAGMGTFAFGDYEYTDVNGETRHATGLFSQVRPAENDHELQTPDGMVKSGAEDEIADIVSMLPSGVSDRQVDAVVAVHVPLWREGKKPAKNEAYEKWATSVSDAVGELPDDAAEQVIEQTVAGFAPPWDDDDDALQEGPKFGYWLLIIAGVGIFCGCVGKSAQFPLHTWLPDAMEGPTPVSALVHSATMVAAGVYLVGRFYPVFAPEVLLVIAIVGCITLFMAATIAITATDIKRVLAYSTVSQLGYMMLALGVGGWLAGMLHLFTHAFFKSLLFMCSGSVIHSVHTNEMPQMGGLLKKMPVTAITMLIGCLAIAGAAIPFVIGLSGYYSKDAILEQSFSFLNTNGTAFSGVFFVAAAGGATITAFYMFRLWFLTFLGKPRDEHRYDHAHESPPVMYLPLVLLAVFAIGCAWDPKVGIGGGILCAVISLVFLVRYKATGGKVDQHAGDHDDHHHGLSPNLTKLPLAISVVVILVSAAMYLAASDVTLSNLLEGSRALGTADHHHHIDQTGQFLSMTWPDEFASHVKEIKIPVTLLAFGTAVVGISLAAAFYWFGWINPEDARQQFRKVYRFLVNKWWFDELYDFCFVRPVHVISRMIAAFDRRVIDWCLDNLARLTRKFAVFWDKLADRTLVDGFVNTLASWTYALGSSLRGVQRGKLREYVMFIVLGTIVIFVLISFFWTPKIG